MKTRKPDDRLEKMSPEPDGKTLVSGSQDFTVKLWNLPSGNTVNPSACSCDTVCTCDPVCSCVSDCSCVSVCSCEGDTHYWYPS